MGSAGHAVQDFLGWSWGGKTSKPMLERFPSAYQRYERGNYCWNVESKESSIGGLFAGEKK